MQRPAPTSLRAVVDDAAIRRDGYRHSPHLGQWWLSHRLRALILDTIRTSTARQPPRVLEVGASHGSVSDLLLAAGAQVTHVESSAPALAAAQALCGANDRYEGLLDPELTLATAPDAVEVALVVSALHHVPDYLALLDRVLASLVTGGTLLTLSDPLFYPRLPATTRRADRGAYLAWRLARGDVTSGLAALRRRRRGEFPQAEEGLTYYHVVRQGVDEQAVLDRLRPRFDRVELITYWSNHFGAFAPVAERAGMVNNFAVRALGHRGPQPALM